MRGTKYFYKCEYIEHEQRGAVMQRSGVPGIADFLQLPRRLNNSDSNHVFPDFGIQGGFHYL
jgi:hypothetical protein